MRQFTKNAGGNERRTQDSTSPRDLSPACASDCWPFFMSVHYSRPSRTFATLRVNPSHRFYVLANTTPLFAGQQLPCTRRFPVVPALSLAGWENFFAKCLTRCKSCPILNLARFLDPTSAANPHDGATLYNCLTSASGKEVALGYGARSRPRSRPIGRRGNPATNRTPLLVARAGRRQQIAQSTGCTPRRHG